MKGIIFRPAAWTVAALASGILTASPSVTLGALKPTAATSGATRSLSDRLTQVRSNVMSLEQTLIETLQSRNEASTSLKKIRTLLSLQREEKELSKKRIDELENTITELESRRGILRERAEQQKINLRKSLLELSRSLAEHPQSSDMHGRIKVDSPRRRVLANMVEMGLKEVEALKVDLADADQLELKIQDEKHQLVYLANELRENEGILEINRQLQVDILQRKHADRVSQLESYRKLKASEAQIENLIQDFNARVELQDAIHNERIANRAMNEGAFAELKGKLPLPVSGKILTSFGKAFDAKSNLHIFKKGIDIETGKNLPVRAVSAGKIAFSGELPNYGRLAIIDHGNHFYSLCGHLGGLHKKAGDPVAAGEAIGTSDDQGTPVYFEIRARNIAVNPLQWVAN